MPARNPSLIGVVLLALGCAPHRVTTPAAVDGDLVATDGVRLHYRRIGTGDTLVFVNGGPGGTVDWYAADLEPLARRHTVILYDQRGSGRSDLPAETAALGIDRHVADLEALRRHFGLQRLTLVAHSFGPLLAASYAIAHPDRVDRMVFLGGVSPYRGTFWQEVGIALSAKLDAAQRAELAAAGQRMNATGDPEACRAFWRLALLQRVARPEYVSRIRSAFCTGTPEAIRAGARTSSAVWASLGEWDLRERLRTVTAPTLVIHGEQDAIPMWAAEGWVASLPHARLVRAPDAGHFLYVERPEAVWPAIEAFLTR